MSLLSHKEKIRSTAVADIIESCIYLKIKAESASSGPPIGPTLGQYGIPAAQFCKDFNERTVIFKKHVELKVVIYLYRSGIYTFELDFPTATFFFKRLLRISLCTGKPGHILSRRKEFVESLAAATSTSRRRLWRTSGKGRIITRYMIYEIMRYKSKFELLQLSDFSLYRTGVGIINSMGLQIIDIGT